MFHFFFAKEEEDRIWVWRSRPEKEEQRGDRQGCQILKIIKKNYLQTVKRKTTYFKKKVKGPKSHFC